MCWYPEIYMSFHLYTQKNKTIKGEIHIWIIQTFPHLNLLGFHCLLSSDNTVMWHGYSTDRLNQSKTCDQISSSLVKRCEIQWNIWKNGNKCISKSKVYKWNYSMVSKSMLLMKYISGRPKNVTYVNTEKQIDQWNQDNYRISTDHFTSKLYINHRPAYNTIHNELHIEKSVYAWLSDEQLSECWIQLRVGYQSEASLHQTPSCRYWSHWKCNRWRPAGKINSKVI